MLSKKLSSESGKRFVINLRVRKEANCFYLMRNHVWVRNNEFLSQNDKSEIPKYQYFSIKMECKRNDMKQIIVKE